MSFVFIFWNIKRLFHHRTILVSQRHQTHELCLFLMPLWISASKVFMGTSEQVHRGWEPSELIAAIESEGKYCCERRVSALRDCTTHRAGE